MEEQNFLNTEIGTKETVSKLKPGNVKIVKVGTKVIPSCKSAKAVLTFEHPDDPGIMHECSEIIAFDNSKRLKEFTLWCNVDEDKKIRKNSALANFLTRNNCVKLLDLVNRELPMENKQNGYLAFKAY